MDNVLYLVFRRMRQPLLTIIVAYSVAILGLTLIPGQDADGNLWRMDFFHAFYFVSFMSTTIGFGEIPYPFTDAQRLWVVFSIFATVVSWIYAIGTLLSLVQEPTFRQAMHERRFTRRVKHLAEPFYLVAGYGQTGSELVYALSERHQHAVVVDVDEGRVSALQLDNLREYVPALHADARKPVHLLEAGLKHPQCAGLVALTNVNEANLKIAITGKLLHPEIKVICRADSHEVEANMASFGTDHIIDPFDTFATHLATALQAPCLYLLHQWLTGMSDEELKEPIYPPASGRWVICGYGRFGKAVYKRLRAEGIEPVVIEAFPEETGRPEDAFIQGLGTEARTLTEAGIEGAVGLVAGTNHDVNNLSIIMTALELNPELFVIARQNNRANQELFDAVKADVVMVPSAIIANKIRVLLATPMLYEFIHLAHFQDEVWACELISRISAVVTDKVPDIWELTIDEASANAVLAAKRGGAAVTLGDLLRDLHDRDRPLPGIVLLREQHGERTLLPGGEQHVKAGDRLLFCGSGGCRQRMSWSLQNENVLSYMLTGESRPQGWVWRRLRRLRR